MTVVEQDRLVSLRENVSELAVLPHVIFSILEPVGPDEPNAFDLDRIVAVDPGFAAKVLVLANSGAFGSSGSVGALFDAIEILGYRTVRTLAMTAGTFEMFVGKNDPYSLRRRRWWRHSVDSAHACRWLAKTSRRANSEEAYTAGLLHLLGKSLLDRYGGCDYSLVTERQASGQRDWEAERSVYGCDHTELLISLSAQWNLPQRMLGAFDYQWAPLTHDQSTGLRACLAIATRLASAACKGPQLGSGDLADCPEWALEALGMSRSDLTIVLDEGIGAITESQLNTRSVHA
ncbi:MAG TPA: HDOD domain-containing protein [Fimbriimonas sp.]|nr:HDOD domain-containing protein [Fimbriimonas sp.]